MKIERAGWGVVVALDGFVERPRVCTVQNCGCPWMMHDGWAVLIWNHRIYGCFRYPNATIVQALILP